MRWSLRLCGAFLLMTVALITVARRDYSGAWIAFTSNREHTGQVYLMTGDGESLIQVTSGPTCGSVPEWSPDGTWITYLDSCATTTLWLYRIRPGGGARQFLSAEVGENEWSPDSNHISIADYLGAFFLVEANDPTQQNPLVSGSYAALRWSPNGAWVYAVNNLPEGDVLTRIQVDTGAVETLTDLRERFGAPTWSPDGKRIAVVRSTPHGDEIVLMYPDGSDLHAVSMETPRLLYMPQWSPDGEWITFLAGEDYRETHIYRVRPDGGGLQQISEQALQHNNLQWSPDGRWLVFSANDGSDPTDIFRMRGDGSSLENLTPWRGDDYSPQYAPVSGLDWHPLPLTASALGMVAASFVWKRRP